MTQPTNTTGTEAVAKIIALQAQRITRIEASLRRIETMLEQTHPMRSDEGGEPHAIRN